MIFLIKNLYIIHLRQKPILGMIFAFTFGIMQILNADSAMAQGFLLGNSNTSTQKGELSVGTSLSGWQFVAQPFTTPPTNEGVMVGSINVTLKDFLLGTDGLFMSLYSETDGDPGGLLVSLSGSWAEGHQKFTPDQDIILDGETTYFLVLGSDPEKEGIFRVVTVDGDNSRTESGSIGTDISIINNSLGDWNKLNNGESFRMDIAAMTVPEPTSAALLSICAGVFFLNKKRKS